MSLVSYKDCVKQAAQNLGLEDVCEVLESSGKAVSDAVQKEISKLLSCVNTVLHEIACDYIPLKKTTVLKSENKRIYFKNISDTIVDIFSVKCDGRTVDFRAFHDCILLPFDGVFEIEYSYTPLKGTLETNLEWYGQTVGERIAAYGAACEYCIIEGNTDDAILWDKRFKDALFKARTPKSEMKIKRRKWL